MLLAQNIVGKQLTLLTCWFKKYLLSDEAAKSNEIQIFVYKMFCFMTQY